MFVTIVKLFVGKFGSAFSASGGPRAEKKWPAGQNLNEGIGESEHWRLRYCLFPTNDTGVIAGSLSLRFEEWRNPDPGLLEEVSLVC